MEYLTNDPTELYNRLFGPEADENDRNRDSDIYQLLQLLGLSPNATEDDIHSAMAEITNFESSI